MPRLSPLPRSKFGLTAHLTDLAVRRIMGKPIEGTAIMARDPAMLRAGGAMERYFLSRRRKTPHRILELVTLRAAMDVGCSFCIDIGSHMVVSKHGVTPEQLRGLHAPAGSGLFTPAEVAALDLAAAMTMTPPTVTDELWARCAEHFDERQLIELTSMIGWENFRARVNHALGVESHGFATDGACAMATSATETPEPVATS
ncbi:MAG: carboxymuconolactone decarboxylase family protein [Solirubrobacteraceae bacterium]|nr:carboxymuconolactone decarboxylase family protein [Solirubrobacteraceae bacterium]